MQELSGSFKEKTGQFKDKIKAATEEFRDDLLETTLLQKYTAEAAPPNRQSSSTL